MTSASGEGAFGVKEGCAASDGTPEASSPDGMGALQKLYLARLTAGRPRLRQKLRSLPPSQTPRRRTDLRAIPQLTRQRTELKTSPILGR